MNKRASNLPPGVTDRMIEDFQESVDDKHEVIETAARVLLAAAKKKYWEDLGDELKALADALGEEFPI